MSTINKSVIARINKEGKHFEILVDPDDQSLAADEVFLDSKKGLRAGSGELEAAFGTTDVNEIAKIILEKGNVQKTGEQRDKERQDKWDRIVQLIAVNAVDPKTHTPIPADTIAKGLEQAQFHIDHRDVESQMADAIKMLRPILAFTFEEKRLKLNNLPPNIAGQCLGVCKSLGHTEKETWNGDGSLTVVVRIPAGFEEDFTNKINTLTHGKTEMEYVK